MATYYVSSSGSDSNNGTSANSPWLTVGKVNTSASGGDTVLFRRGDVFSDTYLSPKSGSSSSPSTYGAYGEAGTPPTFTAAIFLASRSWVVLQDLRVQGAGTYDIQGVSASASGTGTQNITVQRCVMDNVSYGINMSNELDADWTVDDCTISNTSLSGILWYGDGLTVTDCRIFATGRSTGGTPSHGVYLRGPNATVTRCLISDFDTSGVSCRYRNQSVTYCDIGLATSSSAAGLGWFQMDTEGTGTCTWENNYIHDIRACLYVSEYDDGGVTREAFSIKNNLLANDSASGTVLYMFSDGTYEIEDNVFVGTYRYAIQIPAQGTPSDSAVVCATDLACGTGLACCGSASWSESGNTFFSDTGTVAFKYLGTEYGTHALWAAATGQGSGSSATLTGPLVTGPVTSRYLVMYQDDPATLTLS